MGEMCPYSELFWSVFCHIHTKYGEIFHISPYESQMRENADQNNSEYGHFLRSIYKWISRLKWIKWGSLKSYENVQKQPLEVFYKKTVLINFATFIGKYLCWSLFLIKLQVFRSATLLKGGSNRFVFLWIIRNF